MNLLFALFHLWFLATTYNAPSIDYDIRQEDILDNLWTMEIQPMLNMALLLRLGSLKKFKDQNTFNES